MGLEIKETKDENIKLTKNQWFVAMYSVNVEGYHFMRREMDNSWSAKEGWSEIITNYKTLPSCYTSNCDYYELSELYILTNPFAK